MGTWDNRPMAQLVELREMFEPSGRSTAIGGRGVSVWVQVKICNLALIVGFQHGVLEETIASVASRECGSTPNASHISPSFG